MCCGGSRDTDAKLEAVFTKQILRLIVALNAKILEQLLKPRGMLLLILGILHFSSRSNSTSIKPKPMTA